MANTNSLQQQNVQQENEQQIPQPSSSDPCSKFRFLLIRHSISSKSLVILLNKVLRAHTFLLSAERIKGKENEFLIKIELVNQIQSIPVDVLFFYTDRLPCRNVESFYRIKSLLQMIFQSNKNFYGWNFNKQYLDAFVRLDYLLQTEINQINIMDLQVRFKHWYNKTFPHNQNCPVLSTESQADDPSCICSHRPCKNMTDKWNIFDAFRHVFHTRISIPNKEDNSLQQRQCYYLLIYHTTFKLFLMIVLFNWNLTQLAEYKQSLTDESM